MILGIAIPYYCNSVQAKVKFMALMTDLKRQLFNDNILIYVYEDGQVSDWIDKYRSDNIVIESCSLNKGVSYARNKCINYLRDKVEYILFIDSDDSLSEDYVYKMYESCIMYNDYDIIESAFMYKGHIFEFREDMKRSSMTGSAFKSDMIGDLLFDENLQVGEDTKFMEELVDFGKHKKKYCKDAIYYYNYGANPNSLIVRFKRKEIDKTRS